MHRSRARAGALGAALLATSLAACGGSSGSGGGPLAACTGTVGLASDLPTTGQDAATGAPIEKAVRFAVDQANAAHLLGGCTVRFVPRDDASAALGHHDPEQGKQNVTQLVADRSIVGIVGPFNTNVAVAELPVSNAAGLVQISPATTDPGLTLAGTDPEIDTASLQPSGHVTFFRVIANDVVQAQAISQVARRELNLQKIYDVSDQELYGQDMSNYFDAAFTASGGTVVRRVRLTSPTTDFGSYVTDARVLGADSVFFGGLAANGAGVLRRQVAAAGLAVPFLGDDGILATQFITDAGAAAEGAQATAAPDTTRLSTAQQFVQQYRERYGEDVGAYSTFGYDCANILLNAIHDVLVANGGRIPGDPAGFRAKVLDQVRKTDYHGTIGETRFDAKGDTLDHSFAVYVVSKGAWTLRETVSP